MRILAEKEDKNLQIFPPFSVQLVGSDFPAEHVVTVHVHGQTEGQKGNLLQRGGIHKVQVQIYHEILHPSLFFYHEILRPCLVSTMKYYTRVWFFTTKYYTRVWFFTMKYYVRVWFFTTKYYVRLCFFTTKYHTCVCFFLNKKSTKKKLSNADTWKKRYSETALLPVSVAL